MERVVYKGYVIQAAPYPLAESKHWKINLYIEKHDHRGVNVRNFFADNSYPTRDEAVGHCVNLGQQIIDGEAEGLSVDDL